ncbi:MAG: PAS domain S-box protein [Rubrivivax sp.]
MSAIDPVPLALGTGRALQALRAGQPEAAEQLMQAGEVSRDELLQSLQIHQVELQAQAQELNEANLRLDAMVRQFRRLFDVLPQAALVIDRHGGVLQANREAERLFCFDALPTAPSTLRRVAVDTATREALMSALAAVTRSGHEHVQGLRLRDAAGTVHPFDAFIERLATDLPHEVERYVLLLVDETERQQAADRLAAANADLQLQQRDNRALAAVARSTRAMVVMTDVHRRITWTNEAFTDLTGYSAAEAVGRSPNMLQGPGTDPATRDEMRRRLDLGEGFNGVQILNYRKDGTPYWLLLDVQPIRSANGELEGFVSVQIDVTERVEAEQGLRDAEANHRAIFDNTPTLVVTLRADASVVAMNAAGCRLLELPSDSTAVGGCFERFVAPADRLVLADLMQSARQGHSGTRRLVLVGASGARVPVELHTGVLWRHGGVSTIIVIGRDVSLEQALAEERAEREAALASNAAKTRFLSQMSHELRTPLNAVLGFTELMSMDVEEGQLDPEAMRTRLELVRQAGRHLLSMIDDVLDLSRIESGQLELRPVELCVEDVTDEAVAMVSGAAQRRRVTVSWDEAGPRQPVMADRTRLRQVLLNLLSNAIKYNREGGAVRLRASVQGGEVTLEVCDTGRGMVADQLAHLFEPFNRLGVPSTIEGTGIGLVIARSLIEGMGGHLSARSEPGSGSCFVVHLPCLSTRATARSAAD